MVETQTDLMATVYLAYGGFFRQALSVLRSWFEVSVDGVFFSTHYGQPTGRYEQWKSGQRNVPVNMNKIAESLANRSLSNSHVNKKTIVRKLVPLYSFLSEHTHPQGIEVHNLQDGRDNVPRYLPKSFDMWYGTVMDSFDAICFLYRIFFPVEIALYFKKSQMETVSLKTLQKSLARELPEFTKLVANVYALSQTHGVSHKFTNGIHRNTQLSSVPLGVAKGRFA